jgi:hypothetical protein
MLKAEPLPKSRSTFQLLPQREAQKVPENTCSFQVVRGPVGQVGGWKNRRQWIRKWRRERSGMEKTALGRGEGSLSFQETMTLDLFFTMDQA